jgi:hypothetical protein
MPKIGYLDMRPLEPTPESGWVLYRVSDSALMCLNEGVMGAECLRCFSFGERALTEIARSKTEIGAFENKGFLPMEERKRVLIGFVNPGEKPQG